MIGNPFIPTGQKMSKKFAFADCHPTPATTIYKPEHNVREPARKVDMVSALDNQSLLSDRKFSKAGYVSTCDDDEVKIFDGRTAKTTVSEAEFLKGWKCPQTKLWRIPPQANITTLNTDTLVLDGPTGHESLNSACVVPPTSKMLAHLTLFHTNPACLSASEAIHNVYNFPSIEGAVRYLHAAAGFPTKATLLKSIRHGTYLT